MPVQDPIPPAPKAANENLPEEVVPEVNEDNQDVDPEVKETNEDNGEQSNQ